MNAEITLETQILSDDTLRVAVASFDYEIPEKVETTIPTFDAPDSANIETATWGVGLIVGPSGSGKSTLLKKYYGQPRDFEWSKDAAIASQVDHRRLSAVGLNSVPTWCRPYHTLSNGEAFRAEVAARLDNFAVFDEFTSVVDRSSAKCASHAIRRYVTQEGLRGVVFASCHYDIVEWLQPDWVFNTLTGELLWGRCLWPRPEATIEIWQCSKDLWSVFGKHHYLNTSINKSAMCFSATWNGCLVGFSSCLPFPNGNFKNGYREHRTVVLPDYQGFGIGVRLSDFVASYMVSQGKRFFSKTAHPRMGEYRERSPLWKPTSKNRRARQDYSGASVTKENKYRHLHQNRVCFSHEFVGRHACDGSIQPETDPDL